MTQEQSKQAHLIISYFQAKYKAKFNRTAIVNRNKLQYLVANILKDLATKEIKHLLDYYISTYKDPNLVTFCYEYDEILRDMNIQAKDLEKRKALLEQTQKNVIEFRSKYGNAGK